MKNKLFAAMCVSILSIGGLAQGAITIGFKDFSSASVGVPIVNALGAAVPQNTIFVSSGIFSTVPDFTTSTAAQVIAAFTALDGTPVSNTTFSGLFTGNDTTTLSSYPTGFQGTQAYFLVANNATLSLATQVAVYRTLGQVYATPVGGVANTQIVGDNLAGFVYGTQTPVTTQPSLSGSSYTTGIQLAAVAVPEPSAALLGAIGALGLLRRRRI